MLLACHRPIRPSLSCKHLGKRPRTERQRVFCANNSSGCRKASDYPRLTLKATYEHRRRQGGNRNYEIITLHYPSPFSQPSGYFLILIQYKLNETIYFIIRFTKVICTVLRVECGLSQRARD